MGDGVDMGFEPDRILIPLADILLMKQPPEAVKKSRKYQQILASIKEVGIVEPPVVVRQGGQKKKFLLLDGHLRIEVLKELGIDEVICLVATDDEAFTYNKRINRLATIQEHKMILKAVERGVPEDRIARALNVNVKSIREKRQLLVGICPEAAEILKDKHCSAKTFYSLKKMKPIRQVEVAELMTSMNNFTVSYSRALLVATPQNQLLDSGTPKNFKGISPEQIAGMEKEMASLQHEIKLIEESYGPDHLNLVLARGYLVSLLNNSKVSRYLTQNHSEILSEFQKISEVASMGSKAAE